MSVIVHDFNGQYPHVEFAAGNGVNANSKLDTDGDGSDDIDFASSNLHIQCLGQPITPSDDAGCWDGTPRYPFHGGYGIVSIPPSMPGFSAYATTDGNKRLPCVGEFQVTRDIRIDLDNDGDPDDAVETITRFIGNTKSDGSGDPIVIRTRHVMADPGNASNAFPGYLQHQFWNPPLPILDTAPPNVSYDTAYGDGYEFGLMK